MSTNNHFWLGYLWLSWSEIWFAQQELQKLSSNADFTRWEHQTYRQGIVFKVQKP